MDVVPVDPVTITVGHLRDEGAALDELVADLDPRAWRTPTPAPGWTIAHQIGHLLWTDEVALDALRGEEAFAPHLAAAEANLLTFTDDIANERAALPPAELLQRWRDARGQLADALETAPAGTRLPWFGPSMGVRSMATARLMETFAHGQDVADALGVTREPTQRLREIADLGVRTRNFAYALNHLTPPAEEFRIELTAPDGELWAWGPNDAPQRLRASALDFCLLVTQRREPADLDLEIAGDDVQEWVGIAQVFAGPPKSAVRAKEIR